MLHLTFYHGGTCIVLPKFDLPKALDAVQKYKCTVSSTYGTRLLFALARFIADEERRRSLLSSFRQLRSRSRSTRSSTSTTSRLFVSGPHITSAGRQALTRESGSGYILCGAAPLSADLQQALQARLKGKTYVVQG